MVARMAAPRVRDNAVRWIKSLHDATLPDWRITRPSGRVVWGISIGIVLTAITIYARALTIAPLGDDWVFLQLVSQGPIRAISPLGNYHFTPVPQAIMWVIYRVFGTNPVPYHVVALALFCACLVLLLHVAWRVTGSFVVGVVAPAIYLVNGRQYEGVIWTLIALFQTLGMALFLMGLLLYLRLHDEHRDQRSRRWHLIGFYACAVLAVFAYEQEFTLILICALYRLLVLEHRQGLNRAELMQRGRVWLREFGFGAMFLAGYLALKFVLSRVFASTQLPGLQVGFRDLLKSVAVGVYQSFAPGTVNSMLLRAQLHVYLWHLPLDLVFFIAPMVGIILIAKPAYRWAAIWLLIAVTSTVAGIGGVSSRYLVHFLAPSSILWAGFLVALAAWCRTIFERALRAHPAGLRRAGMLLGFAPSLLIFTVYASVGLPFLSAQIDSWQTASSVLRHINREIQSYAAAEPTAQKLYLVNLIGRLPAPSGYLENGPFVLWNGSEGLVALNNPGRFPQGIVKACVGYNFLNFVADPVTAAQVDAWSRQPGTLVLTYDYRTGNIVKWVAGAQPSGYLKPDSVV